MKEQYDYVMLTPISMVTDTAIISRVALACYVAIAIPDMATQRQISLHQRIYGDQFQSRDGDVNSARREQAHRTYSFTIYSKAFTAKKYGYGKGIQLMATAMVAV